MNTFYDFKVQGLDGSDNILGPLRGKVTLAVNVASKCGFTPQYTGLEQLFKELQNKDFTIVGFPCNQFGAQEPGSAEDIQNFCQLRRHIPLGGKNRRQRRESSSAVRMADGARERICRRHRLEFREISHWP